VKRSKDGDGPAPGAEERSRRSALSRRDFLAGAGGVAATGALSAPVAADAPTAPAGPPTLAGAIEVALTVNGERHEVTCEPRTTLLHALRVFLDPPLTGTKEVCDRGNCGACTVLLDDEPVCSCLVLAADCEGRAITTVEGLGTPEQLSPLQESFCEEDALMCGFCTPGFVMALEGQLRRKPTSSLDELKGACAGNVCRCGTYPHVFEAATSTVKKLRGGGR
jgi:xanthine dehydrogenase YagT iron-sulfur-binding subunit